MQNTQGYFYFSGQVKELALGNVISYRTETQQWTPSKMGEMGDKVGKRDAPWGSLEKLEKTMESNKGKGNVLV